MKKPFALAFIPLWALCCCCNAAYSQSAAGFPGTVPPLTSFGLSIPLHHSGLRPAGPSPISIAYTNSPDRTSTPGVELAQTISLITGVAISPLLGAGTVGAWKYFQANTPRQRARLPWFAQPWFWIPALLIVMACFLKDTIGIAVPKLLKKPLDAAEVVEHKISGLIATGAFVPLVASVFQQPDIQPAVLAGTGFLAAIDLSWLGNAIMVSLMMITFFIVCVASSTLNILILLSPFRLVDLALKTFRLFLLSTVAATAFANPWLGAAWAFVIIVLAWFIAGWSFRLSHFGLVFIWDFATRRSKRFAPDTIANRVFLARKFNKVPARSYGTLLRHKNDSLVLKYRPWLILPKRTLTLPPGKYAVAKGLLYSEIVRVEGDSLESTILLPPRYRSHEQELVLVYGFADVRDAGARAALLWLLDLVGFRLRPQQMPPP